MAFAVLPLHGVGGQHHVDPLFSTASILPRRQGLNMMLTPLTQPEPGAGQTGRAASPPSGMRLDDRKRAFSAPFRRAGVRHAGTGRGAMLVLLDQLVEFGGIPISCR